MNFMNLRKKDNLDLMNKRLRCNEYIASLLTSEFSKRLNRIIVKGGKATEKDFAEIFNFPGDKRNRSRSPSPVMVMIKPRELRERRVGSGSDSI